MNTNFVRLKKIHEKRTEMFKIFSETEIKNLYGKHYTKCPRCEKVLLEKATNWEGYCKTCTCEGCESIHCKRKSNGTWKQCDIDGHCE